MPLAVWWGLAATIPVALIIGAIVYILQFKKAKRLKKEYLDSLITQSENDSRLKAFDRENSGKILHELKPKDKSFAQDVDLEYAFNTIARNSYKTVSLWNFETDYEEKSFAEIGKVKVSDHESKYDFAFVLSNGKTYEQIKTIYANLNEKGMIFIIDAPRRSKEVKTLKYDLKLLGIRHEWQDISNGIVLIAK